jgi:hypothetical protein
MAKKGYPGLVLVPPSDRTIFRRRLLRWSFFLIALIWCAATLALWVPTSNNKATCQSDIGQEDSNNSAESCDNQPHSVTEPPPSRQSDFPVAPLSQAEALAEPQDSPSSPDLDRLTTHKNHDQGSTLKSSDPINHPSDHNPPSLNAEKRAPILPASQQTPMPGIDARLAEQGDAFAQYRLGRYYAQRDGRQAPESVNWYKKASHGLHRLAATGNGQAMYVLGVMYAYGRGVTRNTEEARRWLTLAVEHKITAAQPVLAQLEAAHGTDHKLSVSNQIKSANQHH